MTDTGNRVLASLTEKEKALLVKVCQGETNMDIADALGTTVQVIKNRMRQVLEKTGQRNRMQLAIFAFYHGIVTCPCGARKEQ